MRAITLSEPGGQLHVGEAADPQCGDHDVIIKVAACGLCRSDWHVWHGGWPWEGVRPRLPVILGHEVAGTIIEAGTSVGAVRAGDQVTVPFHIACGHCAQCWSGHTNLCLNGQYPGNSIDGGFAELMRVPHADLNCVVLPGAMAVADAAALGCRYMTAWRAVTKIGRAAAGQTAAVYGCGGLGLALIQIATALGLEVIAVDTQHEALKLASRAGATTTINAHCEHPAQAIQERTGGGVHLSFDAAGSSAAAIASVRSLRARGRHVQAGLTSNADAGQISWPADLIVFRELQILGSIGNARPDYQPLLRLIANGVLRPAELITQTTTLEEAARILPAMDTTAPRGLAAAVL